MLSKPQNGWTDFKLKKYMYGLSYLTDLPIDWLNQAIHGLETMQPFAVHAELEPGMLICLVSYLNCYIFIEDLDTIKKQPKSEIDCEVVNITMTDFCKMLYDDLSSDIDGWSNWSCNGVYDKNVFIEKLEQLNKLLKKREKCFKYDENGAFFYF